MTNTKGSRAIRSVLPSLMAMFILCSLSGPFLEYVSRYSTFFYVIKDGILIVLMAWLPYGLFKRRLRMSMILAAALLLSLSLSSSNSAIKAVREAGLYAKIFIDPGFLKDCPTVKFVLEGNEQRVGFCQTLVPASRSYAYNIFIDTADEFSVAPKFRHLVWMDAVSTLPAGKVFAFHQFQTENLGQNVVVVLTDFNDGDLPL